MMEHTVYGIRLKGDRETRYIGMTRYAEHDRLAKHFAYCRDRRNPLADWLNANRANVEAFPIARGCRETCQATEKLAITLCVALGQRLFNIAHHPDAPQDATA